MAIDKTIKGNTRYHPSTTYPIVRLPVLFITLILASMGLAGCVTFTDFDSSQEYNADVVGTLDASTTIGQTFISHRPRLNGMTVWITIPQDQANSQAANRSNTITIQLFHSPEDSLPVYSASIRAPTQGNKQPVYIAIPVQTSPEEQGYFLQLSKQTGSIQVNGRNEDAYPPGQAYINSQPADADIAFHLSYDYDSTTLAHDLTQGLPLTWLVLPLLILLWLPGWLLIDFSGLRQKLDFGEQTGLSLGISLAVIPLLMLWTTILKIKWTQKAVLIVAGALVALLVIRLVFKFISAKRNRPGVEADAPPGVSTPEYRGGRFSAITAIALLLIFAVTLVMRLIMVRDLATPAWVDPVHHALITRLIISVGGYPSTYFPYWDFQPTAYHPGFHSIAAVFTWLSNLSLAQSLLILGQVLNALTVFSVYLLAKTLTKRASIGLIAAAITGFLTPMPAYYTSWGRYTELAGLLILPAALVLVKLFIDAYPTRQKYWLIGLGGIVTGGLFMVHYRVILFLGCLILMYLVIYSIGVKNKPFTKPLGALARVLIVAGVAIILVSPWLFQTVKSTIVPLVSTPTKAKVPFFQDFAWAYLIAALGKLTLVLAGLGLAWGMIRLRRFSYLLLTWVILLFIFANLGALGLPGASLVNNTSVEIMLFMPISILGGYFIDQIIRSWRNLLPEELEYPFAGIIIVTLGVVSYLGGRQLVTIVNPMTVLSRQADLPAIEWVRENIPENESIVINPFAWGYGLYAGNDGGYWISPITGRQTLPPPVLYGMSSGQAEISSLSQKIIDLGSDPVEFRDLLNTNHLHYVFVGARGGPISPQKLSESGLFNILYQKDGVWIFSVKP